jgi:hypothetical protein
MYTPELVEAICERLSMGEPLEEICRGPGMPSSRAVRYWRSGNPEIAKQFDEARDAGFDAIACRARKTARGKGGDDGGDSTDDVQRDKLIIDTDLKLLAKWDPRRYGDKLALGGDAEQPLTVVIRKLARDA